MTTPANRTFYTIVDNATGIAIGDFWTFDKAEAEKVVSDYREIGYSVGYEEHTEADAYGADHDPRMFANPAAPRNRAPKVGRRYRLLRR